MYADLNVPWILDESDTVQAYGEKGRENEAANTTAADGLLHNELAKLNRVQQVELIQSKYLRG